MIDIRKILLEGMIKWLKIRLKCGYKTWIA